MSKLRVVFAGTPEFAVPTLTALINSSSVEIAAVYTQPDRPAGRGQQISMSPVKQLALKHHLVIQQPQTLKNSEAEQALMALKPDVMIVVAYGLILPKAILQIPRYGCLNVHASLLPRWRGAAPIQRTIEAGDAQSGITIMQMDEGLDTGDILHQAVYVMTANETGGSLHDRLAQIGADALLATLHDLQNNQLQPIKQNDADATYAKKIEKNSANIDWHLSAVEVFNRVRAFNPWPITYTHYKDKVVRVWQTSVLADKSAAKSGEIVAINADSIDVATGKGILRLHQLQLAGGKVLFVHDFLQGHRDWLQVGQAFHG